MHSPYSTKVQVRRAQLRRVPFQVALQDSREEACRSGRLARLATARQRSAVSAIIRTGPERLEFQALFVNRRSGALPLRKHDFVSAPHLEGHPRLRGTVPGKRLCYFSPVIDLGAGAADDGEDKGPVRDTTQDMPDVRRSSNMMPGKTISARGVAPAIPRKPAQRLGCRC
jgi:hypothetical protein